MMDESSTQEIDYYSIVNTYIKQSFVTGALEDRKNNISCKLWDALQYYYEAKEDLSLAESTNNNAQLLLFEILKIKEQLDQEHGIMDKKIEQMQSLQAELELKEKHQMDSLFEKMELLYQQFQKLPQEFDSDTMKSQTDEYNKLHEIAKLEIDALRKKEYGPKRFLSEIEDGVMIILNVCVTEVKQQNLHKNISQIQQQLLLEQEQITMQEKKMNDLKVKYGF